MTSVSIQEGGPPRWSNITAIAASGGFAGGGLLIGIAAGGRWLGMDPMVWQQGFWSEFIGFAVAIVPLFLLTIVGLVLSRTADVDLPDARWWWTAAIGMWSVNCAITSLYHLPVNIQLYSVPFSAADAESVRTTWLALHVPRVFLAIGTHLAAVHAALLSASARGTRQAIP